MIALRDNDNAALFVRGIPLGIRLLVLACLSIVLMLVDSRRDELDVLRDALAVAVYPVRVAVDLPFSGSAWLHQRFRDRQLLLEKNERLLAAQLLVNVRLQRMAALEAENARLRTLMESSAKAGDRVLVSEIMAVDLDPFRHRIVLDKGTRHGVFTGQALVDASGVVGQITRAEPLSSEAVLISDPSHAMPVEVNRNGLRTIAVGVGETTRMSLPFLPNNADVRVGDLLVSSGLGGSFPAGYPVARIESIERDPGESFATVAAEPTAALNRSREVLLVWSGTEPSTPEETESPAPEESTPPEESEPSHLAEATP